MRSTTAASPIRFLAVASFLGGLSACVSSSVVTDSAPAGPAPEILAPDPVPRPEARSRYGNGPEYEVYGRRYKVMDSNYGYVERGVASWYGRKFHGRPTSSREPYDMYRMTAAHKSLPLPSFVEVRNLENGRTAVVRVNDRGPFVKNRLIDLSYAAALKLDIVEKGTGMVEVRAISFDTPPVPASPEQPITVATEPSEPSDNSEKPVSEANRVYVQVGAFGKRANAERRHRMLAENGIDEAFVYREADRTPAIYRVRIGPLSGVADYDRVVGTLTGIGIDDSHLVTE